MKHAWSTSFTKFNGNANLISFSCNKANIIRFLMPTNVRAYGIGLIHLGTRSISNRYLWWSNAMALSNRIHYHLIRLPFGFQIVLWCANTDRKSILHASRARESRIIVAHHKNGITALTELNFRTPIHFRQKNLIIKFFDIPV